MNPTPIAAVFRPVRGPLRVRIPFRPGNRAMLRDGLSPRTRIEHEGKGVWIIARPHLRDVAFLLMEEFGAVEIVMDYRAMDRCNTACRDAMGDECVCSCEGENHKGAAHWKKWQELASSVLVARGRVIRRTFTITNDGTWVR